MARNSASELEAIIEITVGTSQSFLDIASNLIDAQLSNSGHSEATLKNIELYLAAHFATSSNQQPSQEQIGSSSATYRGQSGFNAQASSYGQVASMIDTTGIIANLGKPRGRVSLES